MVVGNLSHVLLLNIACMIVLGSSVHQTMVQQRQCRELLSCPPPRAGSALNAGCRQIALYSFTFDNDEGKLTRYLLPLLDLVNHRGDANAQVTRHAASRTFRLEALRAIRCAAL